MKWTRVTDLVSQRKVFLKNGMAYVPLREQSSIVFAEFSSRLEKALEVSRPVILWPLRSNAHQQRTVKELPKLDEDSRIVPILDNLSQGFLAGISSEWSSSSESSSSDQLTAEMIDDLARRHFPACMRNLHDCLRRDKHLKHQGRLQYGLFLKVRTSFPGTSYTRADEHQVLGLSIDEAIAFWRRSFSNIQDDKFNKEYKYNIRHSYGLEGKRANYPARR